MRIIVSPSVAPLIVAWIEVVGLIVMEAAETGPTNASRITMQRQNAVQNRS